jgi:hypothetical protein
MFVKFLFLFNSEIARRFPQIKILDQVPIEDHTQQMPSNVDALLPLPIQSGFFDNTATQEIAMNFLGRFLTIFDQNRSALHDVYDDQALVSITINRSTMPNTMKKADARKIPWHKYESFNRNLMSGDKKGN